MIEYATTSTLFGVVAAVLASLALVGMVCFLLDPGFLSRVSGFVVVSTLVSVIATTGVLVAWAAVDERAKNQSLMALEEDSRVEVMSGHFDRAEGTYADISLAINRDSDNRGYFACVADRIESGKSAQAASWEVLCRENKTGPYLPLADLLT